MARMSGADADELERLGHRMQEAANRLEALRGEVGAAFTRTHWDGEDGQHFRDLWQHRLSALLLNAAGATREASVVVVRNAQQQRAASGDDGTGPGVCVMPWTGTLGGPDSGDGWQFKDYADAAGKAVAAAGLLAGIVELRAGNLAKHADDLAGAAKYTNIAELAKGAGAVGSLIGVGIDAAKLFDALHPGDATTAKAAVLDMAVGIGSAFVRTTPIGLAASFVWDFVISDETKAGIVDCVATVAQETFEVGVDVVQDVGGAVVSIAEGGFNGAKKLLGF